MTNFANKNILSIYDLNQMVKDLLMDSIGHIRLIGEVSNFSKPASGHWYFTLKDDKAQVRCAMFRNTNFKTGFIPKDGQQVIVNASVTLYEARGDYQLIINQLELAGIGLLQQKFEQLKEKLKAEGLFESIYKKTIPKNCQTVGIITSSTGAVLHDICQILKRRDPSLNVIIYPTQVQGEGSADNIARMIKIANIRQECDVLIVGRGGGSLEDLWSFNEEVVARAIFESKLPIISAVGHEVDITIADFVADLRAATPSAAAELISRDRKDQVNDLKVSEQHLAMAMDNLLLRKNDQLQRLRHRLQSNHPQVKLTKQQALLMELIQHLQLVMTKRMERIKMQLTQCEHRLQRSTPQNLIQTYQQRIQKNEQMLITQFKQKMDNFKHIMAMYCTKLNAVSPLATIERGYSITTDEKNHIVRSFKQVKQGDKLVTKLPEGIITSTVTGIKKIRR